ncbi:ParB/RepB/Spo0J family partition protein (plasmid) [Nostoc sp. UHCC 0926]|uniref:ParB/RepB/Spo0J family partition protein n=1 Tax=Nostoc sp. UHCC 0926 TaxID=3025190 RepID=UPI00235FBB5B|nr:ParB/RepB/Spo0J family partition protein [Nostoc sp. UHCC 0926]WDD36000.1 ParB/RepB/Spo0J family partition protein [Nostoc sp. UHCC 0926]
MDGYKIGEIRSEDGSVLVLLNIEDLFPFFQNPVKWCDPDKLMRFRRLIEEGVKFPPITVCKENERLVVYDGHHRWFAAYLAGCKQILAWVT